MARELITQLIDRAFRSRADVVKTEQQMSALQRGGGHNLKMSGMKMMFDRGCRGSPDRCRRIRERGQRGGREWASPVRTERAVLARDGRFGRQMGRRPNRAACRNHHSQIHPFAS